MPCCELRAFGRGFAKNAGGPLACVALLLLGCRPGPAARSLPDERVVGDAGSPSASTVAPKRPRALAAVPTVVEPGDAAAPALPVETALPIEPGAPAETAAVGERDAPAKTAPHGDTPADAKQLADAKPAVKQPPAPPAPLETAPVENAPVESAPLETAPPEQPVAVFAPFAFPADAAGQLLERLLTPPAKFDHPPVPFVTTPDAGARRVPESVPDAPWVLPPAEFRDASPLLPQERPAIARIERAVDAPPLAGEALPALPAALALAAAPPARADALDVKQTAALGFVGVPEQERALPQDDPAAAPTRGLFLAPLGLPAYSAAPLEKLEIPDPFAHLQAARLGAELADGDPPAASLERPAPPVLAVP